MGLVVAGLYSVAPFAHILTFTVSSRHSDSKIQYPRKKLRHPQNFCHFLMEW
jgi:hypothetical protein